MNRRIFLFSVSGTGLALAAGASAFALTRTPNGALAPWIEAGLAADDPRIFVVRHAVLAPNPHNRQPWIVEMTGSDDMTLWCDLDRRLPMTDPFDRQIVIGLGCFLELAAVAATAVGRKLEIEPFPEGEPAPRLDRRPIARMRLIRADGLADPLFAHVMDRRSTKRPYDMARSVPVAARERLVAISTPGLSVAVVTAEAEVARLRTLAWRAWEIEATTKRTHMESVELMRIGRAEIEANPDGISLSGPLLEGLALAGQLSRVKLADPNSTVTKTGFDMYRTMIAATPACLLISATEDTRRAELAAGRAYLRANLLATSLGLSVHPISQALQEFPEMAETRAAMEHACGVAGPARLHMLARLGYGPAVPRTPRWAAATRIRTL